MLRVCWTLASQQGFLDSRSVGLTSGDHRSNETVWQVQLSFSAILCYFYLEHDTQLLSVHIGDLIGKEHKNIDRTTVKQYKQKEISES